jgi:hypothetical protein
MSALRHRWRSRLIWACVALGTAATSLTFACGGGDDKHDIVNTGDSSPGSTDGASEGGADGTTDAPADAARDVASDSTTHDGAADGSPEGASDAGTDVAPFESSVPPEDAGIDTSLPIPDGSLVPDGTDPTD